MHWRKFDQYINVGILEDPIINKNVKFLENFAMKRNAWNNEFLTQDDNILLNLMAKQNHQNCSLIEPPTDLFPSEFKDDIDFFLNDGNFLRIFIMI